jgi:hypothetical protein
MIPNFWCSASPAPPIPGPCYRHPRYLPLQYRLNRRPGPSYRTTDHCIFFSPSSTFSFSSTTFLPASTQCASHLPDIAVAYSIAIWLTSIRLNQTGVESFRMILLGQQSMAAATTLTLPSFLRKQSWQLCHRQFSSSFFLHDLYSCGEAKKWFAAAFCNC